MHYVLMLGVMLISPVAYLFVLLRVDEQATEDTGAQQVETTKQSSLKTGCALDHFYLPNNVHVNHYDLHRLISMRPNRSP
jgi:hypothetical protein